MFSNLKKYVSTLTGFDVTANQFLFLWLTYLKEYALMYEYVQNRDGFTSEEIKDLQEKGYVMSLNQEGEYYVDSYVITDKFSETLFNEDPTLAAQEFWDTYPRLLYIDRKRFSARNTNKDLFLEVYQKQVGFSIDTHKRVMNALRYAINNKLVSMGIQKWFESKQWETIEEEMALRENAGLNELPGEEIF